MMRVQGADRIYVKLKDLRPNPYRRIKTYPIRAEKVTALAASITANDWWENVEVRRAPDGHGYELAYGHHRLAALRKLYKPDDQVGVMLRELSAEQMLRRMADENLDYAGNDALIDIETMGAVIEAYGAGDITLPAVPPKTPALSMKHVGGIPPHIYTLQSVSEFLGWLHEDAKPTDRARTAFAAWHALQDGWVKLADFHALRQRRDPVSREAVEAIVAAGRAHWEDFRYRAAQLLRQAERAAADAVRKGNDERAHALREKAQEQADALREAGREKARSGAARARQQYVEKKRTAESIRRDPIITRSRRQVTIAEWIRAIRRDVRAVGQTDQFAAMLHKLLKVVEEGDVEPDELLSLADDIHAAREAFVTRWTQYEDGLRKVIRTKNITPVKKALPEKRS
jgi:ParB-like nuclease domain